MLGQVAGGGLMKSANLEFLRLENEALADLAAAYLGSQWRSNPAQRPCWRRHKGDLQGSGYPRLL